MLAGESPIAFPLFLRCDPWTTNKLLLSGPCALGLIEGSSMRIDSGIGIVWEIFADGASPYLGMQLDDVKRNVISGKRLQMPPGTPPWLRALIVNHVWQQDPANRCDMSKVVRLMKRYMRDPRDSNGDGHSSRHGTPKHKSRSSSKPKKPLGKKR